MKLALLAIIPLVVFADPYNRQDWPHWADLDGDCQDTRAEVLIIKSTAPLILQGCRVIGGRWFDPYTGEDFTDAGNIDIDHVVPLKEAHDSGGEDWSRARKKAFANDHENLLPVSASANRSKGSKDPAQWMPPLAAYHCEYAARWLLIKSRYQLAIDDAERIKLIKIILAC